MYICCDSRASIAALTKTTTESALLWESMQALETWSGYNKVTLVRTPGHHGIPRNEEADKLAKEGANGVPSGQTVGIPFVVGKEAIRSHLR
jgi:ribonuclease HI